MYNAICIFGFEDFEFGKMYKLNQSSVPNKFRIFDGGKIKSTSIKNFKNFIITGFGID